MPRASHCLRQQARGPWREGGGGLGSQWLVRAREGWRPKLCVYVQASEGASDLQKPQQQVPQQQPQRPAHPSQNQPEADVYGMSLASPPYPLFKVAQVVGVLWAACSLSQWGLSASIFCCNRRSYASFTMRHMNPGDKVGGRGSCRPAESVSLFAAFKQYPVQACHRLHMCKAQRSLWSKGVSDGMTTQVFTQMRYCQVLQSFRIV